MHENELKFYINFQKPLLFILEKRANKLNEMFFFLDFATLEKVNVHYNTRATEIMAIACSFS